MAFFKVLGYAESTGETVERLVDAATWPIAVRDAILSELDDFQFVAVLPERSELVGTWEAMPGDPPGYSPQSLTAMPKTFTIVLFDEDHFVARAEGARAVDWVTAAHAVLRALPGRQRFIAALAGIKPLVGTYHEYEAALREGNIPIQEPDPEKRVDVAAASGEDWLLQFGPQRKTGS